MPKQFLIGCVADDFTGASDAASFLLSAGLKTILVNGTPNNAILLDFDAIVIALKSRTQAKEDAIHDSLEAFEWLSKYNAKHLYFKYCSTFDSTKEGNIGPVLDAIIKKYNVSYSILCPALPVNNRIVKNGTLYVDNIPLHESHMKDHPLTPMWASRIEDLMKEQGEFPVLHIDYKMMDKSTDIIKEHIKAFASENKNFYIVPDYINDTHAKKIADIFSTNYILSGGSGILSALGKKYKRNSKNTATEKNIPSSTKGKGIILAGSCSKMTRAQVSYYKNLDKTVYKIDPLKLLSGEICAEDVFAFVMRNSNAEVLVYASGSEESIQHSDSEMQKKCADILEKTLASIALMAVNNNYTRIICAGGETSSAITKELGFNSFIIGKSIAPGVPIMIPISNQNIRLVLKSGNFGQEDFFPKALEITGSK